MATHRQKLAASKVLENGGNVSRAMREAGYSPKSAKTPKKLTASLGWQELLEKNIPDKLLIRVHKRLLKSNRLGHMVFPTTTTDQEIKEMIESINCTVRKIAHGDQATHVWFWEPNTKAQQDAMDTGYKLKDKFPAIKNKHSGDPDAPLKVEIVDYTSPDDANNVANQPTTETEASA